ncbi:hypothetical protein EAX62_02025 [Tessaracoccus antarcticus]|uniref:Tautomerase cis-CaaD-like domain-containing protein n=2 Tax=Tessaracoccus antarcticus TaxID=2479848 RepID=A0A3M0GMI4_9ACTN|nr:hypothetical protein EAX62_02025 [Tessaracoccus antarcticus]
MPTYTVSTSRGQLDDATRPALARAITAAHTAAPGAPGFFAQVRFEELEVGRQSPTWARQPSKQQHHILAARPADASLALSTSARCTNARYRVLDTPSSVYSE